MDGCGGCIVVYIVLYNSIHMDVTCNIYYIVLCWVLHLFDVSKRGGLIGDQKIVQNDSFC